MSIKNRLKEFRHDKRMNQTEFASFLGINISQYSRYETQKMQPNLETALEISEKLNVTVNSIFQRVSE
ncbi:transcriptional regulator [Anaerobacillus alkalilacustris]|uniref:Transcriptional regulator n=1 Tax=Anaerobacillus alkalilacustris TaxID=393763 RepID=A0A1S2LKQ4_9BACI|nr:helix-turn-helix transcriptional regulator [Anaerobacillus alkalilacustris]OIJ12643.1 transcriptional regulator [Anaerobacillus alkalilacustris]